VVFAAALKDRIVLAGRGALDIFQQAVRVRAEAQANREDWRVTKTWRPLYAIAKRDRTRESLPLR